MKKLNYLYKSYSLKLLLFIFVNIVFKNIIKSQVSLSTGSATFSLPMFNWQDDKSRLNSVVALNYSSGSGLKVNEVASNVGTGWNLIAGGVITRMQVGEPDDQMKYEGNGTIEEVNKYPAGYLYNSVDASQGCPNALTKYPIFGDQNHTYKQHNLIAADRVQDYFSFQFNGRSGMFVLDKNSFTNSGNSNGNAFVVGDSKVKVAFQTDFTTLSNQNIRTTITSFTIQDENGLIYNFTKHVVTKVLRKSDYESPGHGSLTQDGLYDQLPVSAKPNIITGWYLTEVEDILTHRKILINYLSNDRSINNQAGIEISYFTDQDNNTSARELHRFSVEQVPAIESISFPDNYSVVFNYSNNQRYDLHGDYPLKSVNISYNGRPVSSYQFNTSYFIKNIIGYPATELQGYEARLCLKSVIKVGPDLKENEPPYLFDYNMGSNASDDYIPPPFWLLKDSWGYYNGNKLSEFLPQNDPNVKPFSEVYAPETIDYLQNTFILKYNTLSTLTKEHFRALCFRYPTAQGFGWHDCIKPGYAKNGLLKQITYPSGSTLAYEYEQNNVSSYANIGGVHVSKTITTDGGYSNGISKPIVTNYNYTDEDGNSSVVLPETPDAGWGSYSYAYSGTSTHYAAEGSHYHLFAGCSYDYMYPGILSIEESQSASSQIDLKASLIRKLTSLGFTEAFAAAVMSAGPLGIAIDVVTEICIEIVNLIKGCQDYLQDNYTTVWSNDPNYLINPAPAVFKRVEVVQGQTGDAGKSVYEFTSPDDYPIWNKIWDVENESFSLSQRSANWAYGLPKKVTVLDKDDNIIKQTENLYDYSNAKRDLGVTSCNCYADKVSSINSNSWKNFATSTTYTTTSTTDMRVALYNIYTGRVELTDSYERTFKPSDQTLYSEIHTKYDYNQANYQLSKITTTESNGDQHIKEIYYPVDYTASGIFQTLNTDNLVNLPVATFSSIIKSGQSGKSYLQASVTDFTTLNNGDIKPISNYTGRSTSPVQYSFDPANPFNYPNLKQTQSFTYDAFSNLIGVKDEGNHTVANIYDYNDKFIIASVINADALLDNCAYTSFETQNLGGWVLSGTPAYSNNSAVTGTNCFIISSNNSLSSLPLNANKAYKVTFWANNSNVLINGNASILKSQQTINGFSYYETEIPQGSSNVTVSTNTGNINIDELRLYPKSARMRTVTYDPLLGKTADCDENNRVIFYEYDNLGRMRFIKDENKHIVKMYEYNEKQSGIIGTATVIANSSVYAKLSYENTVVNALGNITADIIVRFYTDPDCTHDYYVNNLLVNYNYGSTCDNGCNSGGLSLQTPPVSGTSAVLATSVSLTYQSSWQDQAGDEYTCSCQVDYEILEGTGYIIAN